jgi:hypothetical protein
MREPPLTRVGLAGSCAVKMTAVPQLLTRYQVVVFPMKKPTREANRE